MREILLPIEFHVSDQLCWVVHCVRPATFALTPPQGLSTENAAEACGDPLDAWAVWAARVAWAALAAGLSGRPRCPCS